MAVLSAWLSSKMAPRMERSASRLLGRGRSRVESVAMGSVYLFAFSSLYSTLARPMQDIGLPVDWAHAFSKLDFSNCARSMARRQLEWLCKVSENVAKLFRARFWTRKRVNSSSFSDFSEDCHAPIRQMQTISMPISRRAAAFRVLRCVRAGNLRAVRRGFARKTVFVHGGARARPRHREGMARPRHSRFQRGGGDRRKNYLFGRIWLRGPRATGSRLAKHKVSHWQRFETAHFGGTDETGGARQDRSGCADSKIRSLVSRQGRTDYAADAGRTPWRNPPLQGRRAGQSKTL